MKKRRGGKTKITPNKFRLVALGSIVVALAIAVFGLTEFVREKTAPEQIGGPFTLTDHFGKTVTDQDFHGKFLIVYFGYTFCPDVCPTGLQTVAETLDLLDPEQMKRVTPLFISVDPERDTPELMKEYVSNFHDNMIGLSGTREQIDAVAAGYRARYKKVETGDEFYLIDHTALLYVMDADGKYRFHMPHVAEPDRFAERLRKIM